MTMDRIQKAAIITKLVEKLRDNGSWCGETHIQKATMFLQELTKVPLRFEFILYKHGPFSFDLRDELTSQRADGLLKLESQWPYGPRIVTTDQSKYIQKVYLKTLQKYDRPITFVAEKLGTKGVDELERVATAFFVTEHEKRDTDAKARARILTDLKPHITADAALAAVVESDGIQSEWSRQKAA